MRIKTIEVYTEEKYFKAILDNGIESYIVKPSIGRHGIGFESILLIAEYMVKKRDIKSNEYPKMSAKKFNNMIKKGKDKFTDQTIYNRWTEYLNISTYIYSDKGDYPFELTYFVGERKKRITKEEKQTFAKKFFHHDGGRNFETARYWIGDLEYTEIIFANTYKSTQSKMQVSEKTSTSEKPVEYSGYIGTDKYFETIFKSASQYDFIGRKEIIENINCFIDYGKIENNSKNSNLLLILGEPGSGKSALMTQYLLDKKQNYVHFLIDQKSRDLTNPKIFLNHIQLFLQNKHQINIVNTQGEIGELIDNLTKTLNEVSNKIPTNHENEIIYIDGLDNCDLSTRPNIATIVSDLISEFPNTNIKFVITSRDGQFLNQLHSYSNGNCIILKKDDKNEEDILEFLQINLRTLFSESIINNILEKVNGNFLCTTLWVKYANNLNESKLTEALLKCPPGLDGFYDLMIDNLEKNKSEKEREMIRDAMRIIAIAPESLTSEQVLNFCSIDYNDKKRVLGTIEQFLNIEVYKEKGLCKYHHIYFEEYIISSIREERIYHDKIVTYFENMCGNDWKKLDDYGFTFIFYHYINAMKFNKAIACIEGNFIEAKLSRKGIYGKILPDIGFVIEAAKNLIDFYALFKYTIIYNYYLKKDIEGINKHLIPLCARLGNLDSAVELVECFDSQLEKAIGYARIASNSLHRDNNVAIDFMDKSLKIIDSIPINDETENCILTVAKEICLLNVQKSSMLIEKTNNMTFRHSRTIIVIFDRLSKYDATKCLEFIDWINSYNISSLLSIMDEMLSSLLNLEPKEAFTIIDKARHYAVPPFYTIVLDNIKNKTQNEIIHFIRTFMEFPAMVKILDWEHSESRNLIQFFSDKIANKIIETNDDSLQECFNLPLFCDQLNYSMVKEYVKHDYSQVDSIISKIKHSYFKIKTILFLYKIDKENMNVSTINKFLNEITEDHLKIAAIEEILKLFKTKKALYETNLLSDILYFSEKSDILPEILSEFADIDIHISLHFIKNNLNKFLNHSCDIYIVNTFNILVDSIIKLNNSQDLKTNILNIFENIKNIFLKQSCISDHTFTDLALKLALLDWKEALNWIELIKTDTCKKTMYTAIAKGMVNGTYTDDDWQLLENKVLDIAKKDRYQFLLNNEMLPSFTKAIAGISIDEALNFIDKITEKNAKGKLYQELARYVANDNIQLSLEIARKDERILYDEDIYECLLPKTWPPLDNIKYIRAIYKTLELINSSKIDEEELKEIISIIIVDVANRYNIEESIKIMNKYLPSEKLFPLELLLSKEKKYSNPGKFSFQKAVASLIRINPEDFINKLDSSYLKLGGGLIVEIIIDEITILNHDRSVKLYNRLIKLIQKDNDCIKVWEEQLSNIQNLIIQNLIDYDLSKSEEFILSLPRSDVRTEGLVCLAKKYAMSDNLDSALDFVTNIGSETYYGKEAIRKIIESIPVNKKDLDNIYNFIEDNYNNTKDKNDLFLHLIGRYIEIDTAFSNKLIHKLPFDLKYFGYSQAILASLEHNIEYIDTLIIEVIEEACRLIKLDKTKEKIKLQFKILELFSEFRSINFVKKDKIKLKLLYILDAINELQDEGLKVNAKSSICKLMALADSVSAINLLSKIDFGEKLEVIKILSKTDMQKALNEFMCIYRHKTVEQFSHLYTDETPKEDKDKIFLDLTGASVLEEIISHGNFKIDELLSLGDKFIFYDLFKQPFCCFKIAVEMMINEDKTLNQIIKVIKKYARPELYYSVCDKLINEKSFDEGISIISKLESDKWKIDEELINDLSTCLIMGKVEKKPLEALGKIQTLNEFSKGQLYKNLAIKLWDSCPNFAERSLEKSESILLKHFNDENKDHYLDIIKFRYNSAKNREDLFDIMIKYFKSDKVFNYIISDFVLFFAKNCDFDNLTKLFNVVSNANNFINKTRSIWM